jgi:hypothetical protein
MDIGIIGGAIIQGAITGAKLNIVVVGVFYYRPVGVAVPGYEAAAATASAT